MGGTEILRELKKNGGWMSAKELSRLNIGCRYGNATRHLRIMTEQGDIFRKPDPHSNIQNLYKYKE